MPSFVGDPFSIYFNMMKIKYNEYDKILTNANFLQEHDKINVFINLETVFKYLTMISDLEKKLILQKQYPTIFISNILNLSAHYKRFFISNGLDTRIYLYHTYNDEYRSYYIIKYNNNPKFVYMTDGLKSSILPETKSISEFIPRVYYISSHNIEGSLVPYIIGEDDKTRKNLIITGEFNETQYSLIPNYFCSYIHTGLGNRNICNNIPETLEEITKKTNNDLDSFCNTYSHYGTYCSLLSVLGDRTRSVDGLNGIGPKILEKYIQQGLIRNEIQLSTTNPNMIGNIFHDEDIKEEFINNFYCMSLIDMHKELSTSNILGILNQRKDRFDNESLIKLNATKFYNYPLTLEALCL